LGGRGDHPGPQHVSRILADALAACGLDDRLEERTAMLRWREIVGPEVAEHARPVDLQDGVLVLEADHGAWRQELSMLVPVIIDRFNELCGAGTVATISWRERPARGGRPGRNHD
jgi:predicted nucleic acid-binding Zn ribbon protein